MPRSLTPAPFAGAARRAPTPEQRADEIARSYVTGVVGDRLVFQRRGADGEPDQGSGDWATVGGCIRADLSLGLTAWVSPYCPHPAEAFEVAARRILQKGPLIDVRA